MTATLNLPEPPITRKPAARERPWLPAALALGWVHLWLLASAGFAQTTPQSPKHKASVQPSEEVPSYFLIPFQGTVGRELIAQKVKEAMAVGLKNPRTVFVLEFDSPGGLISECEAILALLAEQKERRSIAFIKNAYSAAAILALACDEIYMLENSSIGSAQAILISNPPSQPQPQTQPRTQPPPEAPPRSPPSVAPEDKPPAGPVVTEAHEKIQSVWRSICRRAADLGGHSPLLAEAMADPDIQIRLVEKDGKNVVEQFLEAREEDLAQNRILKPKGKLLTLTGREAVNCGLATAVVGRLSDIEKKAPGLSGWKPVSDRGKRIMDTFRGKVEKAEKTFREMVVKAGDELRLAVLEDPAKSTYNVDGKGNLTAGSYDLLVKQCTRCANHLNNCEAALKQISELGKNIPFLDEEAKAAQEKRVEIRAARERIQQFAKRFKLPTMKKLGL